MVTNKEKRVVLFDWGGTLMVDFPEYGGPMAFWPRVEAIGNAAGVLKDLHRNCLLALATNAADSSEEDIRAALRRGGFGSLPERIYSCRGVGHRKPSLEFFAFILEDLAVEPARAVMVGDDFEGDVLGANRAGIKGVWLNRWSDEIRTGKMYRTINDFNSLAEILAGLFTL